MCPDIESTILWNYPGGMGGVGSGATFYISIMVVENANMSVLNLPLVFIWLEIG